ncbi:MAG: hypothetical protein KC684_07320, partial [Candidatus Omnitrophica bacterium]|nr:hypothetical protein [Candidatus Omnitrophota bacterium]
IILKTRMPFKGDKLDNTKITQEISDARGVTLEAKVKQSIQAERKARGLNPLSEQALNDVYNKAKNLTPGESIVTNDGETIIEVAIMSENENTGGMGGQAMSPMAFELMPVRFVIDLDGSADAKQSPAGEAKEDNGLVELREGSLDAFMPKAVLPDGVRQLADGETFKSNILDENSGKAIVTETYAYSEGRMRRQDFTTVKGSPLASIAQEGKDLVKVYDKNGNYQYAVFATDTKEHYQEGDKGEFLDRRFGFAIVNSEGDIQPLTKDIKGYLSDGSLVIMTPRGEIIPTDGGVMGYKYVADFGLRGGTDMRTVNYANNLDKGYSPQWAETLDWSNPTPVTLVAAVLTGAGVVTTIVGGTAKAVNATKVASVANKLTKANIIMKGSTWSTVAQFAAADVLVTSTVATVYGQEISGVDLFNAAKGGAKTGGFYVTALTGGGAIVDSLAMASKARKTAVLKEALYDSQKLAKVVKQRQLTRALQGGKYFDTASAVGMATMGGGVNATRGVLDAYFTDGNLDNYGGLTQFGTDFGVGAAITTLPGIGRGILLKQGGISKAIATNRLLNLGTYGATSVIGGKLADSHLGMGANFAIGFAGAPILETLPGASRIAAVGTTEKMATSVNKTYFKAMRGLYKKGYKGVVPKLEGETFKKITLNSLEKNNGFNAWASRQALKTTKAVKKTLAPFSQKTYTDFSRQNAARIAAGEKAQSELFFKTRMVGQAGATGFTGGYLESYLDPELKGKDWNDSERFEYAGYGTFAATSLATLTILRPKLHQWSRTAEKIDGTPKVIQDVDLVTLAKYPNLIPKMTFAGAADFSAIMTSWSMLDPVLFAAAEGTSRQAERLFGAEKEHDQTVWEAAFEHSLRPRKEDGTRLSLFESGLMQVTSGLQAGTRLGAPMPVLQMPLQAVSQKGFTGALARSAAKTHGMASTIFQLNAVEVAAEKFFLAREDMFKKEAEFAANVQGVKGVAREDFIKKFRTRKAKEHAGQVAFASLIAKPTARAVRGSAEIKFGEQLYQKAYESLSRGEVRKASNQLNLVVENFNKAQELNPNLRGKLSSVSQKIDSISNDIKLNQHIFANALEVGTIIHIGNDQFVKITSRSLNEKTGEGEIVGEIINSDGKASFITKSGGERTSTITHRIQKTHELESSFELSDIARLVDADLVRSPSSSTAGHTKTVIDGDKTTVELDGTLSSKDLLERSGFIEKTESSAIRDSKNGDRALFAEADFPTALKEFTQGKMDEIRKRFGGNSSAPQTDIPSFDKREIVRLTDHKRAVSKIVHDIFLTGDKTDPIGSRELSKIEEGIAKYKDKTGEADIQKLKQYEEAKDLFKFLDFLKTEMREYGRTSEDPKIKKYRDYDFDKSRFKQVFAGKVFLDTMNAYLENNNGSFSTKAFNIVSADTGIGKSDLAAALSAWMHKKSGGKAKILLNVPETKLDEFMNHGVFRELVKDGVVRRVNEGGDVSLKEGINIASFKESQMLVERNQLDKTVFEINDETDNFGRAADLVRGLDHLGDLVKRTRSEVPSIREAAKRELKEFEVYQELDVLKASIIDKMVSDNGGRKELVFATNKDCVNVLRSQRRKGEKFSPQEYFDAQYQKQSQKLKTELKNSGRYEEVDFNNLVEAKTEKVVE